MKEFTITTLVKECGIEELDASDRRLVDSAREATRSSYSPYSKFHVGAALQLADGSIVCGSNQENAAYPSGDVCGAYRPLLCLRHPSRRGDKEDCHSSLEQGW